MKLTITIESDNAAFERAPLAECRRIVRDAATPWAPCAWKDPNNDQK